MFDKIIAQNCLKSPYNQPPRLIDAQSSQILKSSNNRLSLWSGDFDVRPEYQPDPSEDILPFCIAKNTITNLFAPAGSGKSFLAVAIARTALLTERVREVWYIDGDNSLRTIFQRNLLTICKENKNFHYISLNNSHFERFSGL